jgi:hypothetical protein
LTVLFGATSVALIRWVATPSTHWPELLGFATGSAAMVTALAWIAVLGARRHVLWVVAALIPYVNLVAASSFARRYWGEGARAPALLGIAGVTVQTVASLYMLVPALPALV